jgi:uncharacterized protein YcgI (DUF1989 family)
MPSRRQFHRIFNGRANPGDYVDLVAERDVIVAIFNCPQLLNPCKVEDYADPLDQVMMRFTLILRCG